VAIPTTTWTTKTVDRWISQSASVARVFTTYLLPKGAGR
jgi:hypothetical protein